MGVLPLQFKTDSGRLALGLTGSEVIDISIGAGVKREPWSDGPGAYRTSGR